MDEAIRDRVIRLINEMRNRTIERGATPAEAAGFASKVAEWIEKYQIDESELRVKSGAPSADINVTENIIRTGKKVFNPGVTQVVSGLSTVRLADMWVSILECFSDGLALEVGYHDAGYIRPQR